MISSKLLRRSILPGKAGGAFTRVDHGHFGLSAGLLWVMGLEAVFSSSNKHDFKRKSCDYLGSSARVVPDWKTGSGSVCSLWGRMVSCAPIGNRRKLGRLTIGPQVANSCQPAPQSKLTHYRRTVDEIAIPL